MAVECDLYGFFNGIYGLEQSNWSNYWRGIIPDGVLSGFANEMKVTTDGGLENAVIVKPGQAMIDNHRVWITAQKRIPVSGPSSANPRIDLIVLRIVYGNNGETVCVVDVKTGTPAASPAVPGLTQVTGGTYEIPLAQVRREKGTNKIVTDANITDRRYIFKMPSDDVVGFTGTSVTAKNDCIHRNNTAINSLTVVLPENPHPTFITEVNFTSSSSYKSTVTFKAGSATIATSKIRYVGDTRNMPNKRYSMIIWWDGKFWWVANKAVAV